MLCHKNYQSIIMRAKGTGTAVCYYFKNSIYIASINLTTGWKTLSVVHMTLAHNHG